MPPPEFARWLAERGVECAALRWPAAFARSGRGVAAARDLARGELLLSVPEGCMLTAASAAALLHPWLDECWPALRAAGHDEALVLALALLRETGRPVSAWRGYLRELPARGAYACVLSEWRADELALLGDPDAAAAAQERRAALAAEFAGVLAAVDAAAAGGSEAANDVARAVAHALQLRAPAPGGDGRHRAGPASAALFRWARHTIQSRVMLSGLDHHHPAAAAADAGPVSMSHAVVPLGDMFNHHAGGGGRGARAAAARCKGDGGAAPPPDDVVLVDAEWVRSPTAAAAASTAGGGSAASTGSACCYQLRAPCAIPRGAELALSYGDLAGRELLDTYGFVLPLCDNPAETWSVELGPLRLLEGGGSGGRGQSESAGEAAGRLLGAGSAQALDDGSLGGGGSAEADDDPQREDQPLREAVDDPLPAAARRGTARIPSALLAARRRLFAALGSPPALELGLPPGAVDAMSPHDTLPCPLPIAQPSVDTLAQLRCLVLGEADWVALAGGGAGAGGAASGHQPLLAAAPPLLGAAGGGYGRVGVQPERLTRAVSRDNELAALRLLQWLLTPPPDDTARAQRRGGELDKGPPPPPSGEQSFDAAAALARTLLRRVASDSLALALHTHSSSSSLAAPPDAAGGDDGDDGDDGDTDQGERVSRARVGCALQLRVNRGAIAVSCALYVAQMLGVAEGRGTAAGAALAAELNASARAVNQALAALTRGEPHQPPPHYALEVQSPWAELLLAGDKAVETRGYALPAELLPAPGGRTVPVALVRAPPGGLAAAGLAAGELIGVVGFAASARYADAERWAADEPAHRVPAAHPAFGWAACGGELHAWTVADRAALPSPVPVALAESQRLLRSVFRL